MRKVSVWVVRVVHVASWISINRGQAPAGSNTVSEHTNTVDCDSYLSGNEGS